MAAQRQMLAPNDAATFADAFARVADNIETFIRGKQPVVRLALTSLFAEGHLLVEDVPGLGKTSLARAIAASLGLSGSRIQFTPDLLPSDVTGVTVYHQNSATFEFHPGPIFANIVLADEINRASPKTQSALLEVMAERTVTVDGNSRAVERPFLVIATQNPIDMDGTFPLPEAQLDRFLMRISMGYPDSAAEQSVLRDVITGHQLADVRAVVTPGEVLNLIELAKRVHVADNVLEFVVALTDATRKRPEIRLGASPRGGIGLISAAQVWAATEGRNYVTPDDIVTLVEPVLGHRLVLSADALAEGITSRDALRAAVANVAIPQG